ncbi:MAG: alpha/beta hydrolase [Verrucomicrobiota bacterium]
MFTTVGIALFVILLLLAGCQRRLIYHPRAYPTDFRAHLPNGMVELAFETASGRQTAFYLAANGNPSKMPANVWVCFHGNAATALHWLNTVGKVRSRDVGFLLVDYPGYGVSAGHPTRDSIAEAAEGAYQALARHYQVPSAELDKGVSVLAFSIGTAAGLDFAGHHPVKQVVLLAPFTSLMDMARRIIGWPLCLALLDRFDNSARLDELAARTTPPRLHLFHGGEDEVVPVSMGKSLAKKHPTMIEFHAYSGTGHNTLLETVESDLLPVLSGEGHTLPPSK